MCVYPILWKKSSHIYLIWTKNTQYPIYWFASKYASSMLLAQVLCIISHLVDKSSNIYLIWTKNTQYLLVCIQLC